MRIRLFQEISMLNLAENMKLNNPQFVLYLHSFFHKIDFVALEKYDAIVSQLLTKFHESIQGLIVLLLHAANSLTANNCVLIPPITNPNSSKYYFKGRIFEISILSIILLNTVQEFFKN